ncbi:hypothetical protein Tsubulata_042623 [Turnera subulata]|uniref:Phorbol-ester/DAG-type domain-containing protein n=1 Tax=Turnera subulata TaxID=218843 RepID=A0A9Q0F448_9ROSI|nr:hypothetical protein Tsubulata_042623 [Turnera subulata]
MAIKHWSHEHGLHLYDKSNHHYSSSPFPVKYYYPSVDAFLKGIHQPYNCCGCDEALESRPHYACNVCSEPQCYFALCESCFSESSSSYPQQVHDHPDHHHPHPLLLLSSYPGRPFRYGYICDGCNCMSRGFVYRCGDCDFNLDIQCAISSKPETHDQVESWIPRTSKQHFIHPDHQLRSFFNYRVETLHCELCGDKIRGAAYGCCDCGVNLHDYCAELALKMLHPYHPHHPLRAYTPKQPYEQPEGCCRACRDPFDSTTIYGCLICRFHLHASCAAKSLLTLPMKHERHQHCLHFLRHKRWKAAVHEYEYQLCDACKTDCQSSYYFCLECSYNIHLGCIGLPDTVDHSDHIHPLTLEDSFVEDDSGWYYCHVCGKQRNGDYPIYHCKQCPDAAPFAAHIECVLSQEDPWINSGLVVSDDDQIQQEYPPPVEYDERKRKPQCKRQIKIEDFNNNHALTIHQPEDSYLKIVCDGCKAQVHYSPYYTCKFCNIHYHKLCAELPLQIKHPLHPQHLLAAYPSDYIKPIFCDGCLHVSFADGYKCQECPFELDLKCASSLTLHQFQNSQSSKNAIVDSIHDHKLTPVTCTFDELLVCHACIIPVYDTAYACFHCSKIFHESCSNIPIHIQHPYHPQHLLIAQSATRTFKCKACNYYILLGIQYVCIGCKFALHASCAGYLTSTLKSSCHDHILFSFAKEGYPKFLYDKEMYFGCKVCGKECDSSFFRCVGCDINFHLHCIPLPQKVKHEWHRDPLTLVDSMCEDDTGEYYCGICAEKRHPYHGAYYCKECNDQDALVIAHIGCLLDEDSYSKRISQGINANANDCTVSPPTGTSSKQIQFPISIVMVKMFYSGTGDPWKDVNSDISEIK